MRRHCRGTQRARTGNHHRSSDRRNSATNLDPAGRHRRSVPENPSAALQRAGSTSTITARRSRVGRIDSTPGRADLRGAAAHGVLFHDGRELTADDVVYTFRQLPRSDLQGPLWRLSRSCGRRRVDPLHGRVQAEEAARLLSDQPGMGIVQAGSGSANARHPDRDRPLSAVEFVRPTIMCSLTASIGYYAGRPRNDGVRAESHPRRHDARSRAAQGLVDLIVNDLSARHRVAAAARGTRAGGDSARAPTTPTSG